jgi:hypothetical protein
MLLPALEEAEGVEEEIAQICQEEIEAWRARPTMRSLSSLKKPMTDTRKRLREIPLTEVNRYFNEREAEWEHVALRYLNYSQEEWAAMNAASAQKLQERQLDRKFIDHPERVVERAAELLKSKHWYDLAVGLAVATGRRLTEVLKTGSYQQKTIYTMTFKGQLKRKDKELKLFEIPTLVEGDLVFSAWERLRKSLDCSILAKEQISSKYGPIVVDAAQRHFAELIPARLDGDLYTHLFRAVYGRIACHYYARPQTSDLLYMATIYGHYWLIKENGELKENYASTMHYTDYLIGDGKGNIDGRQGIKLGEPGVVLLEKFQEREAQAEEEKKVDLLPLEKKKDHSATRMEPKTKNRLDQLQQELKVRTQDEALNRAMDDHYLLDQMAQMLGPLYERLETDNPVGALRALLRGTVLVDQQLAERWQTSLSEVTDLLEQASESAADDNPYQKEYTHALEVVEGKARNGEKELSSLQALLQDVLAEKGEAAHSLMPVLYLRGLLSAKAGFLKSYEKRHAGKDYAKMSTTELRNTKMPGAAQERFRRAVQAIMDYNDQEGMLPEMRWYVTPAVVTDLVGGRPPDAKEYIQSCWEEIDAHHQKYKLRPGYNRRSINIRERVSVPELPTGEGLEAEERVADV